MTKVYLSLAEVSDRLGRNHNAVKALYTRGKLPAPDVQIGRGGKVWNGWSEKTIDAWAEAEG
ncbi:hypothetical protein CH267_01080 [Rhodococcus sp. 06-621-2]|nr:hypothetical protein [Rhodococcus sp. 06-621-2]OZC62167.1 hypothetical protein CH267_01080 [Rhodococcus sp. 06-621-2]